MAEMLGIGQAKKRYPAQQYHLSLSLSLSVCVCVCVYVCFSVVSFSPTGCGCF